MGKICCGWGHRLKSQVTSSMGWEPKNGNIIGPHIQWSGETHFSHIPPKMIQLCSIFITQFLAEILKREAHIAKGLTWHEDQMKIKWEVTRAMGHWIIQIVLFYGDKMIQNLPKEAIRPETSHATPEEELIPLPQQMSTVSFAPWTLTPAWSTTRTSCLSMLLQQSPTLLIISSARAPLSFYVVLCWCHVALHDSVWQEYGLLSCVGL